MATIKPIEARSIHQIQSGQVIVDLCSVVKELVENGLDSGATTIEVRFKNNGLDSIEVQDNGSGIAPSNYETVALKHYTSKLSSYEDLTGLRTFGFRGEALSSLCALSHFHMVTAQADEAPKGRRLDFETSGKLKSTQVVACQKGTTAAVEDLFETLPVRRKELTKNIKREYGKVVGLLHAYACISTGIKFTVKNSMPKGKAAIVFATRGNQTTRENIANVYGAKTLSALLPFELELELAPNVHTLKQAGADRDGITNTVVVRGHISRPVFGEGRQTPDRQMFFVNSRPCGLPQISKAINEVYKSFNVSQSPFVFVDFRMDTNSYDVNVSPDKRTILLHDAADLIESLKVSLLGLFEKQDQTVPQSQLQSARLPGYRQLTIHRQASTQATELTDSEDANTTKGALQDQEDPTTSDNVTLEGGSLLHAFFKDQTSTRPEPSDSPGVISSRKSPTTSDAKERLAKRLSNPIERGSDVDECDEVADSAGLLRKKGEFEGEKTTPEEPYQRKLRSENGQGHLQDGVAQHVEDFNSRMAGHQRDSHVDYVQGDAASEAAKEGLMMPRHQPNIIQNAFDRIRPKRPAPEMATITIGDKTITTMIGSQVPKRRHEDDVVSGSSAERVHKSSTASPSRTFGRNLRDFVAPGTQTEEIDESAESDASGSVASTERDYSRVLPPMASSIGANTEPSSDVPEESADDVADAQEESGDNEERVGEDSPLGFSPQIETSGGMEAQIAEDDSNLDTDYIDEEEEKAKEKARVAKLVREAEENSARLGGDSAKRANKIMRNGILKDPTVQLQTVVDGSIDRIEDFTTSWVRQVAQHQSAKSSKRPYLLEEESAEERLSLTVSKSDFSNMRIIGQFNLGFILAVRPGAPSASETLTRSGGRDEFFIIDQHASDEKYNFERLQAETVVGNQRLVRPRPLELTAVEEEIILENLPALEKNGFVVDIDTSGDEPIGQRCKLVSLPLSKEVVFDTRDLEELIHLLSENPSITTSSHSANATMTVPRPSKVRKMFAMRACRSSIMIGKTLTNKQMERVVKHMGEMNKPWNCPHGRPTMRHLMSLDVFDTWAEGEGLVDEDEAEEDGVEIWEQWTG